MKSQLQKIVAKHLLSIGLISCIFSTPVYSAPGVLDDRPLNLSTKVKNNILFLLDDSGSMDWEQLISAEAQAIEGVDGNGRRNALDFTPESQQELRELCVSYNVMAFNPDETYVPWSGVDNAGNPYQSQTSLTAARTNPFLTATRDISGHYYLSSDTPVYEAGACGPDISTYRAYALYTMNDDTGSADDVGFLADSGGLDNDYNHNEVSEFVIEIPGATQITLTFEERVRIRGDDDLRIYQGDSSVTGVEVEHLSGLNAYVDPVTILGNAATIQFTSNNTNRRSGFAISWNHPGSGVSDTELYINSLAPTSAACAASANCHFVSDLDAAGQENYANWYTYYRKREYISKRAMSDIITSQDNRIGFATLNNNKGVATIIQDMEVGTNRQDLLRNMFQSDSKGFTPLRHTLHKAGQYYQYNTDPDAGYDYSYSSGDGDAERENGDPLFDGAINHNDGLSSDSSFRTISNNSPILSLANGGACQQNFTVLFSDGFWNQDIPSGLVGDTDSVANSGEIADLDGGTFADNDGGSSYSDTLADVAMMFYEQDLAPDLLDLVGADDIHRPKDSDGEYRKVNHQHMVTYTVAFGLNGTVNVDPDVETNITPGVDTTYPWPKPNNGARKIDDMRHAAWNGRGRFLNSQKPQELIDDLKAAVSDIENRTGTASAASFNSGVIRSDTLLFRSTFRTDDWRSDIEAFGFDADGNLKSDVIWSADEQMTTNLADTTYARKVITYNGTQGVDFEFPSDYGQPTQSSPSLSTDQISDLLTNRPDGFGDLAAVSEQDYGEAIVDYIKGSNDNLSANGFRQRSHFLGAFVHSTPQYVDAVPSEPYPNLIQTGHPYSEFRSGTDTPTRPSMVYAGASDGMLHGFNAASGDEVFAYIPSSTLLKNSLHSIADPDFRLRAYVDGTPTIRDVFVGGQWRTYLVGGLRSGGSGIYVLDLTEPSSMTAVDMVKAEFTDTNLGLTYSRPQIAKMNNGDWAAIFGNGYNAEGTGIDGKARLYILNLSNFSVKQFVTPAGSVVGDNCNDGDSGDDCNGLSPPALVDLNGDAIVDRIYAGDLFGNMWAFDVTGNESSWGIAHRDTSDNPVPLFSACDGSCTSASQRHPITAKPVVGVHPGKRSLDTRPNLIVYFGTGQYLVQDDVVSTESQAFYGVWDAGELSGNIKEANLTEQTITFQGLDTNGVLIRQLSNNVVPYSTTSDEYGWYIEFTGGERGISTPLLLGDILFFTTISPTTALCQNGGSSFLMAVEAIDGSQPDFQVFDSSSDVAALAIEGIAFDPGAIINNGGTKVITSSDNGASGGATLTEEDVNVFSFQRAGRKAWSIIK